VSKEKKQTCKECRFYKQYSDVNGSCRRFPPIVTNGTQMRGYFPIVEYDDWCGEFEAKLDADEMIDISLLKSLSRGSREFECDK